MEIKAKEKRYLCPQCYWWSQHGSLAAFASGECLITDLSGRRFIFGGLKDCSIYLPNSRAKKMDDTEVKIWIEERRYELMAKSTVKFNCGCGFTTTNPLEAVIHSDSTGHTLDVNGRVQPDKPKKERQ